MVEKLDRWSELVEMLIGEGISPEVLKEIGRIREVIGEELFEKIIDDNTPIEG